VYHGFLPAFDRLADTITVVVDAHKRPVVLPVDGLEMDDTSQDGRLLEMIEPPLTIGCIDECSLMRAIDCGGTLFKHNLPFVGTIDIL